MSYNSWIEVDSYKDLPEGMWLVESDSELKPYDIAYIHHNGLTIIGGHFGWDHGRVLRYKKVEV